MTEAYHAEDEAEQFVSDRIFERCQHFITPCQQMQEGTYHPHWRTAEAHIKAANQGMFHQSPEVAPQYYFHIHYKGRYKSNDYTVDATPEPEEESDE